MKVFQRETHLRTAGGLTVTDITDEVNEAVAESGIRDGIACVYSPHTTCCVRVNEWETGFLEDFARMLQALVPRDKYYAHDDWDRRTENLCPEDMETGNSGRRASRCPSWAASSRSAPGSVCSSWSSTASATGAGSSRSSAPSS